METFTSKISFLRQVFGKVEIARDNINVAVSCPACNSETDKKKLSINLETWNCHCWVCGVKGKNPYKIIRDSIDEHTAKEFKEKFNLNINSENNSLINIDDDVKLPQGFLPLFIDKKNIIKCM